MSNKKLTNSDLKRISLTISRFIEWGDYIEKQGDKIPLNLRNSLRRTIIRILATDALNK